MPSTRLKTATSVAALVLAACTDTPFDTDVPSPSLAQEIDPIWQPETTAIFQSDDTYLCGQRELAESELLDVGQRENTVVEQSGDRLLSLAEGRWILWDARSRMQIASGAWTPSTRTVRRVRVATPLSLVADLVMVDGPNDAIEVRAASDGHLLFTLPATAANLVSADIAPDGSYVYRRTIDGLEVYSRTGQLLLRDDRSYSARNAVVRAMPGFLYVVWRAEAGRVLEVLPVAEGGATRRLPLAEFGYWFDDASRFIVEGSDAFRIYTPEGTEVATYAKPEGRAWAGGYGNFFWIEEAPPDEMPSTLHIYRIGEQAPLLSLNTHGVSAEGGAGALGIIRRGSNLLVRVNLRGTQPEVTEHRYPVRDISLYVEDPSGRFTVQSGGVMYESASFAAPDGPLPIGCGAVVDIAGSRTGHVAIATADNRIRIFDRTSGSKRPVRTLKHDTTRMALSRDGNVLLAEGPPWFAPHEAPSLRAFAVPDGALLRTWPGWTAELQDPMHGFAVSADGSRVARRSCYVGESLATRRGCLVDVGPIRGDDLYSVGTGIYGPKPPTSDIGFSPNGQRIALSTQVRGEATSTVVWDERVERVFDENFEYVPFARTAGAFGTWLDDDRMLVTRYTGEPDYPRYAGAAIVDVTGTIVATPQLPSVDALRPIDAHHVYAPGRNEVYELPVGSLKWHGPAGSAGDVVGDEVVFESDDRIRVAKFR